MDELSIAQAIVDGCGDIAFAIVAAAFIRGLLNK
ncbi:Uncharacterised protein [Zhongshania aliphaticivorans]|jgi:hypothetical protein|nr:Uncharacterised protein [Zhongshania aliphaticivorans]